MASLNIRRDVTDPFYRYKMEPLVSKIEGKGNGIKSVIVNLSNVAQQLGRSPQYLVKFFGFELGAQVKANPTDDRWIINGAHEASKLQDYLDTFINKFVLCKECKNPETVLKITKDKQSILRDCKACGQRTPIDPRSRLFGFIMKNPPNGTSKKEKSSKKDKAAKKGGDAENGDEKNGNNSGSAEASDNGDLEIDGASDDEFTRRINNEAKELGAAAEELKDDDDWAVDMSEEAVKARQDELERTMKAAKIVDEEEEDSGDNPYEELGAWIVAERESGNDIDDIEVYKKAVELGIATKHRTLQVLAQTIFDENIIKQKQIAAHAALLKKMITSERHERSFLGGTERLIGKDHTELISQVPSILMQFYQEDLITEESVKAWGTKASKKYVDLAASKKVRKAAEPFLKWLEEAEDESEEEDDE